MGEEKSAESGEPRIDRRTALKLGAAMGGALAFNGLLLKNAEALDISRPEVTGKMHILGANDENDDGGILDQHDQACPDHEIGRDRFR